MYLHAMRIHRLDLLTDVPMLPDHKHQVLKYRPVVNVPEAKHKNQ